MKELMIAVERVVRPVYAGPSRKMKMRQELLAHLTSAYDDARSRLGNDEAARDEALRRFGDPKDLTRELQASVPFYERVSFFPLPGTKWAARLARRLEGKLGESASRRAARWVGFCTLTIFGLLWGPSLVIYESSHDADSLFMAAEWFTGNGVILGVFMVCAYTAYVAISGSLRPLALLRATIFAALALVVPAVGGAALMYGIFGLPIQYATITAMIVIGFVLILSVSLAARFNQAARRRKEEWTKLEIGD